MGDSSAPIYHADRISIQSVHLPVCDVKSGHIDEDIRSVWPDFGACWGYIWSLCLVPHLVADQLAAPSRVALIGDSSVELKKSFCRDWSTEKGPQTAVSLLDKESDSLNFLEPIVTIMLSLAV